MRGVVCETKVTFWRAARRVATTAVLVFFIVSLAGNLLGQTNCDDGNGPLNSAQPKNLSVEQVIEKLGAAEAAAQQSRLHYTFKQDVLMQTLSEIK